MCFCSPGSRARSPSGGRRRERKRTCHDRFKFIYMSVLFCANSADRAALNVSRQVCSALGSPLRSSRHLWAIGCFKKGPKRKCEEQSDFHWLGERRGGDSADHTPRLSSRPGSGSRFLLHTSGSSYPWSTLLSDLSHSLNFVGVPYGM